MEVSFPKVPAELKERQAGLMESLENLSNEHIIRGDCKELLQLVLSYLKEDTMRMVNCSGAISTARWMNKLLYCMKIYLFSSKIDADLPKGTI